METHGSEQKGRRKWGVWFIFRRGSLRVKRSAAVCLENVYKVSSYCCLFTFYGERLHKTFFFVFVVMHSTQKIIPQYSGDPLTSSSAILTFVGLSKTSTVLIGDVCLLDLKLQNRCNPVFNHILEWRGRVAMSLLWLGGQTTKKGQKKHSKKEGHY